MGQGRGEEPSGGAAGAMEKDEKEAMRSRRDDWGSPSSEWWAGFGTVTGALEGFGLGGFDMEEQGGKCLFL